MNSESLKNVDNWVWLNVLDWRNHTVKHLVPFKYNENYPLHIIYTILCFACMQNHFLLDNFSDYYQFLFLCYDHDVLESTDNTLLTITTAFWPTQHVASYNSYNTNCLGDKSLREFVKYMYYKTFSSTNRYELQNHKNTCWSPVWHTCFKKCKYLKIKTSFYAKIYREVYRENYLERFVETVSRLLNICTSHKQVEVVY